MPFAGVNPKWFTAVFIGIVLVVVGGFAANAISEKDKPSTKTQLEAMGFVVVDAPSDYSANVSLPNVAGKCRLKIYKKHETWHLRKPSFTKEGSVVSSATQARKLPEVEWWCGLSKQ